MPANNDIELRDRAIVAFLMLTGVRDGALVTLKMKHINIDRREVYQNPREVKTKDGKTILTFFYPVGEEIEGCFRDYYLLLRDRLLFGPDDPLFPKTKMAYLGPRGLKADGLTREHWADQQSMAKIVKKAFQSIALSYSPHAFRHTLASIGERSCGTPEQFKAWSQNLGHENPQTTFNAYGYMSEDSQERIMARFWENGTT